MTNMIHTITGFVFLVTLHTISGEINTEEVLRKLQELSERRSSLAKLKGSLNDISTDYTSAQKRWGQCALGGLPGHTCRLPLLQRAIDSSDWLNGPAYNLRKRRSVDVSADMKKRFVRVLDDLSSKQQALEELRRMIDSMHSNVIQEQKRHCLNLGGHCSIEGAANLHDTFRYYNSALSPGRRDLDMLNKLLSR